MTEDELLLEIMKLAKILNDQPVSDKGRWLLMEPEHPLYHTVEELIEELIDE